MALTAIRVVSLSASREADARTLDSAPELTGTGVVLAKNVYYSKMAASFTLVVRIKDRAATLDLNESTVDGVKWAQTEVGQTVSVTYRMSKSGVIVLDDWEPKR